MSEAFRRSFPPQHDLPPAMRALLSELAASEIAGRDCNNPTDADRPGAKATERRTNGRIRGGRDAVIEAPLLPSLMPPDTMGLQNPRDSR
jgi:hypothetical protein